MRTGDKRPINKLLSTFYAAVRDDFIAVRVADLRMAFIDDHGRTVAIVTTAFFVLNLFRVETFAVPSLIGAALAALLYGLVLTYIGVWIKNRVSSSSTTAAES